MFTSCHSGLGVVVHYDGDDDDDDDGDGDEYEGMNECFVGRWRYNPLDQSADPLEWAVEGSDDPSGSTGWVSVHEMSSKLNSIYSLPSRFTANGIQFWPRNGWTQLFNGSCVVPEGQVWRSLSLGTAHACGINTAGAALCWGHNDWNQVRDLSCCIHKQIISFVNGIAMAHSSLIPCFWLSFNELECIGDG